MPRTGKFVICKVQQKIIRAIKNKHLQLSQEVFIEEKMNEKAKQSQKDLKHDLKRSPRRSYLLRLWSVDEPGGLSWQASLEIPETHKRIGFASLEELFAYLMDLTTT